MTRRDRVTCLKCGEKWHSSWCRVWSDTWGDFVPISQDEFVCVTCRARCNL